MNSEEIHDLPVGSLKRHRPDPDFPDPYIDKDVAAIEAAVAVRDKETAQEKATRDMEAKQTAAADAAAQKAYALAVAVTLRNQREAAAARESVSPAAEIPPPKSHSAAVVPGPISPDAVAQVGPFPPGLKLHPPHDYGPGGIVFFYYVACVYAFHRVQV
jgi:hypothetical protein